MIPDHLAFSIWVPEESLGSHSPWKFCKTLMALTELPVIIKTAHQLSTPTLFVDTFQSYTE